MKFLFCNVLFLIVNSSICIGQGSTSNGGVSTQQTNNGPVINLVDVNGKPFNTAFTDVDGSIFLTDEWQWANLQLSNYGNVYNAKIRVNLLNNYLHFIDLNGVERYKEASDISTISILNKQGGDSVIAVLKVQVFEVNKINQYFFCEQLTTAPMTMLKKLSKKIVTNKNDFTREISNKIVLSQNYFIDYNNKITEVKLKESYLNELMESYWAKVEAYVNKENLSIKKTLHLVKIINYFNSIYSN